MFKNCLNILRDNEHLTGDKALRNLAYFLVLRLIEPKINEMGMMDYDYPFDEYDEEDREKIMSCLKFSVLISNKEENYPQLLPALWDCILSEHPKTKGIFIKDKSFDITYQSTYTKIFKNLSKFDFSNVEVDIQGEAYEEVIKDIMIGKTLGQFFTPPLIKKFIVNKVKPKVLTNGKIETVFDPAMGTGGFLITALRHFMKESGKKSIPLDWNFISNEGIYGREAEPDTYQLAKANMLISTGYMFGKNLERDDTIRNPIQNKYDIVMTNPPFGIKGLNYSEITSELRNEYLPIKSNSAVPLFLQAIIYMLKINGRCGVVLPDGQELFGKQKMLVSVREYLMKTCDLKEVVYIPGGVFTHTSIKTCVFFFEKKKEGTDVLQTKVSYSKKTNKETRRSYKFIKEHTTEKVDFTQFDLETGETKLLVSVPIEKLVNNGYSLNYSEYLEVEDEKFNFDNIEVKTLGEVCEFKNGNQLNKKDIIEGNIPVFGGGFKIVGFHNTHNRNGNETIICGTGAYSGYVNHNYGKPFWASQCFTMKSKNINIMIDKYLYYYSKIILEPQFMSNQKGTAIPFIRSTQVVNIKIPIPALEVQKDIVEQLDFIYEQCIVKSENKIQQLKKLNEMYLKNRIQFENNEKTLGEVCEFKSGNHSTKKCNFIEGEYLIIGGGKKPIGRHNEYNCKENTILCASHGTAGYISMYPVKTFLTMAFAIIENEKLIDKMYLYLYLKYIEKHLFLLAKGTAQPCLSKNKLKNIKIPIPPLQVQKEIVDYCNNNNNLIKKLELEIERNKDLANKIINSFCQKVEVREDNIENSDKKISSKKKIILKTSDKNCEYFE